MTLPNYQESFAETYPPPRHRHDGFTAGKEALELFLSKLAEESPRQKQTRVSEPPKIAVCPTGAVIALSFPQDRFGTPDYWSFNLLLSKSGSTFPLSHSGIAIDLFKKLQRIPKLASHIRQGLEALTLGQIIEDDSPSLLPISPQRPILQSTLQSKHDDAFPVELDVQELFWAAFFLLLRDELNAPYPYAAGRSFGLDRYAETVHAGAREAWRFESVQKRIAAGIRRFPRWGCCDYSYVTIGSEL